MLETEPGFPEEVVTPKGTLTLGYYYPRLKLVRLDRSSPSPDSILRHELNHHRKQALSVQEMIFRKNFRWTLEFYNNLVNASELTLAEAKYALMPDGLLGDAYNLLLNEVLTDDLIADSLVAMEVLDAAEDGDFEALAEKVNQSSSKRPLVDACDRLYSLLSDAHDPYEVFLAFEALIGRAFQGFPDLLYQNIGHQIRTLPADPAMPQAVMSKKSELIANLTSASTELGEKFPKEVPDTRLELLVKLALLVYEQDREFEDPRSLADNVERVAQLERITPTNRSRFDIRREVDDAAPALSEEERLEWSSLYEVLLAPARDPDDPSTDPQTAAIGYHLADRRDSSNFLQLAVDEHSFLSDADEEGWPCDIDEKTLAERYAEYIYLYSLKRQWNQHLLAILPLRCREKWYEDRVERFSEEKRSLEGQWDHGEWTLVTQESDHISLTSSTDPYARYLTRVQGRTDDIGQIVDENRIELEQSSLGFIDHDATTETSIYRVDELNDELPDSMIYPSTAAALSTYLTHGQHLRFSFDEYLGGMVARRIHNRASEGDGVFLSLQELMTAVRDTNRGLNERELPELDENFIIWDEGPEIRVSKRASVDIKLSNRHHRTSHIRELIHLKRELQVDRFNPVEYNRLNKILYRLGREGGFVFWVDTESRANDPNESIDRITVELIVEREAWYHMAKHLLSDSSVFDITPMFVRTGVDTDFFPKEPMEGTLSDNDFPRELGDIPGIGETTISRLNEADVTDAADLVLRYGHYKDRRLVELLLNQLPPNHESSVREFLNDCWDVHYGHSEPNKKIPSQYDGSR